MFSGRRATSDIPVGAGSSLDLHFENKNGYLIEDKTLADGSHLYSEVPIADALDDLSDEQIISIAEAILQMCTRQSEDRPMTEGNKLAFDKLVAETADNPPHSSGGLSRTQSTGAPVDGIHYDIHELNEIKEAIVDYYD